jgi:DNA-binding NarL/FixJ family response regulator
VRVVIGEDEALLRRGLQLVLGQAGFDVVATTADAVDLVSLTLEHRPDSVDARTTPWSGSPRASTRY